MADLVRNVTGENYGQLGSDFIAVNGGTGFIVALRDGQAQGVEYMQTLRQWGAWYAYFVRIKHKAFAMLKREYYTVPAEWPHLFDATATFLQDVDVGAEFERRYRAKLARESDRYAASVNKVAIASAGKARMRSDPRKQPTPPEHLEVAPEIDPPWKTDMRPATHLLETDILAE